MDTPDVDVRSDEGEDVNAIINEILMELINTAAIPKNSGSDDLINNCDLVAEGVKLIKVKVIFLI